MRREPRDRRPPGPALNTWLKPSTELLRRVTTALDNDRLHVHIERELPLQHATQAWDREPTPPKG
ncbi:hypothetical protein GCM10009837_67520 [Streptomyces durmitorensis]